MGRVVGLSTLYPNSRGSLGQTILSSFSVRSMEILQGA